MPIGPLMIEHRLIERLIAQVEAHLESFAAGGRIDPDFVDTAVDFIRTYADRCHHGKEEDILFRELASKPLSDEQRATLDELVDEHQRGRQLVGRLVAANAALRRGDDAAADTIAGVLRELVAFYPAHIEKEDKHFFVPVMEHFDQTEQQTLLAEGHEFDRQLIHQRYRELVETLERVSDTGT